ncbi:lysylphosphatidylglycerol synthase transmembrane domain-containing protein [Marinobacter lutaoensis]|jgi:uncharacterized protein (TIRG00374 family)|uniref:lysylphosphatidylglycerol synthase transmembrane domain-containing protein n=1 Tax=Marinobacter lutaoensis TaxID=135739 RepID=UPI0015942572|nr:lysylphosphatidylglycerol synthase transmembrane domain-containing protein [Marinobacter lutaoensis]MDY6816221.1 lysylphosphatidylglycerol synthase transmembrane domain-containing protein [Pseudomonadota bacterium]NVD37103.1 flippase-like domain-containing protein [Marinobacter lutaoensis]
MKRTSWLLGAGLIAALAIPLLLGGPGLFAQLRAFPLDRLLFMLGLVLIGWNLNALRLRLLLAGRAGTLGQPRALGIVISTEFAYCATPGGTGGPVTLLTLLIRHGMRPTQASAVFAVDQLIDMLFFLFALVGVALYVFLEAVDLRIGWMVGVPLLLLSGGLIFLGLLLRHYSRALKVTGTWLRKLKVRSQTRFGLTRRLLHFRLALLATLSLPRRTLALAFLLSAGHWLLRYSLLYLAITGLGQSIAWAWTFLVQMLSMAAGHLSFLPGGAGGTELTSLALLAPMIAKQEAAAAILIWRFVTYYFYLMAGAPVFLAFASRSLRHMWRSRRA